MKMSDKEKEEKGLTEQLGPITVSYEDETPSSLCGLCRGGSHKAKQRGCKPRRIV